MASKPDSGADKQEKRDRLPFEPSSSRKKGGKSGKGSTDLSATGNQSSSNKVASNEAKASVAQKISKPQKISQTKVSGKSRPSQYSRQETAIPEAVSRRMIKRMAILCGIPTVLGLSTFIISYFIVINGVIDVPPIAVLLVSLGLFGLGVLGISYGALSTSWDVDNEAGSLLGWDEFTTNLGRMKQAWQESRNQSRS